MNFETMLTYLKTHQDWSFWRCVKCLKYTNRMTTNKSVLLQPKKKKNYLSLLYPVPFLVIFAVEKVKDLKLKTPMKEF